MKKKNDFVEIDLINFFITIWKNKYKIILICFFFVIIFSGIFFFNKPKYSASTAIKTINLLDLDDLNELNFARNIIFEDIIERDKLFSDLKKIQIDIKSQQDYTNYKNDKIETYKKLFPEINEIYLINLFIEELSTGVSLKEAIIKYQLLNKKNFKNEKSFLDAVNKKSLSFNLTKITNNSSKKNTNEPVLKWNIDFKVAESDVEKYSDMLNYLNELINKKIKEYLINNFKVFTENLEYLNKVEIYKINKLIDYANEQAKNNLQQKLLFLKNQASIAREINLENNASYFEIYKKNIDNDKQLEVPYYLKGYRVIEKEIQILKSNFDNNFLDVKLGNLKLLKNFYNDNQNLNLLKNLFLNSSINKKIDFKSAEIQADNIQLKKNINFFTIIIISTILGLIIGILYVFFSNALISKNKKI